MTENTKHFDVLIIGGGPGGLSAALWCAELGLKAIVLEKEIEFGGQLLWTFNTINNYLGTEHITGHEMRDRFVHHIEHRDIKRLTGVSIAGVDLTEKSAFLVDGTRFVGQAIIIATGVRRRKLSVPGEEGFAGRGILESGVKNRGDVRGKTVVIVGGGDAALENAIILSETAEKAIVVHRRADFSARAEFIDRVMEISNISCVFQTTISAINGNLSVASVELHDAVSGQITKIVSDALLIRIGVIPNTELLRGQLALDENGYIEVNADCATNVDCIYAIGDAANPGSPTISTAVGMGATATKAINIRLNERGVIAPRPGKPVSRH